MNKIIRRINKTAALKDDVLVYIKNFANQYFLKSNISLLTLFSNHNRLINELNNKFNLKIPRFNIREFLNITYVLPEIYDQLCNRLIKPINTKPEIFNNIDPDNLKNLELDQLSTLCQYIIKHLNTKPIQKELMYSIAVELLTHLEQYIPSISRNAMSLVTYYQEATANNNLDESILITWIRQNLYNVNTFLKRILENNLPEPDREIDYDYDEKLNEEGTSPNTWIDLTDEEDPINGVRESDVSPIYFSNIRISPLVVLDDKVLKTDNSKLHHNNLIDNYRQEIQSKQKDSENLAYTFGAKTILEEFGAQNMAIGSLFNGNVALLEYITDGKAEDILDNNNLIMPNNGDPSVIINALKNKGITKIYLQNVSPWVSREYERLAKLIYKKN